jgi:thioredoxin-like negative regulator of GroEL
VHDWATSAPDGPIGDARRAAAAGRWREALEGLLAAFDDDPAAARESMVDVFTTLGDDPLVGEFRPKLAARLF